MRLGSWQPKAEPKPSARSVSQPHSEGTAFRHLPPWRKDVVKRCLEFVTARHQTPSQKRDEGQPSCCRSLPGVCTRLRIGVCLVCGHSRGATDPVVALRPTTMMMMMMMVVVVVVVMMLFARTAVTFFLLFFFFLAQPLLQEHVRSV